ncbi:MAG TPA: phage baseplate assembly protein V [Kaistia sp.]|jgi:phage baseplate assembly protein V|nr:phage baseplate assembly protein V [Kaistia sp.]
MKIEKALNRTGQCVRDAVQRVRLMVARAVVGATSDASMMQTMQVHLCTGEVKDGVERLQQYGFTSVPHRGAEGVCLFVGGNRDHGVLIAVDDRRYRLKGLADGEVALYTDEDQGGGHRIVLRRDRKIEISAMQLEIKVDQELALDVGNGANRLVMTPAGTDWRMADFEAHQFKGDE